MGGVWIIIICSKHEQVKHDTFQDGESCSLIIYALEGDIKWRICTVAEIRAVDRKGSNLAVNKDLFNNDGQLTPRY